MTLRHVPNTVHRKTENKLAVGVDNDIQKALEKYDISQDKAIDIQILRELQKIRRSMQRMELQNSQ